LADSTSALGAAHLLPDIGNFTVATSFTPAIDTLKTRENVSLIGLGGEYYPHKNSFNGAGLLGALARIRVDVFFGSSAAVDVGGGYSREPVVVAGQTYRMDR